MDKFIRVNNVPVRYSTFGKGQKIVLLLHGYLETMEVWEEFGGQLGKSYKVVALDLPGSGWSGYEGDVVSIDFMADAAVGVLKDAKVEKVTVVGHSMGGYVAISIAQKHPDMVENLILLHSTPNADSDEKKEARKREIELVKEGKKEVLAKINPAGGFAKCNIKKCEDSIEELYETVVISDDNAIIATLKGLANREDKNDIFAALPMNKVMIFGDDDNYIPIDAAKALEAKFSQSVKTYYIEKAGHMSYVEQPDKLLTIFKEII